MTDPLDILFENLLEHLDENLPGTCWPLYQRESRLENALLASPDPGADRTAGVLSGRRLALHGAGGALPLPLRLPPGPGAVTPSRRASSPLTRPSFGRGLSGGCGLGRRFGGRLLLGRRLLCGSLGGCRFLGGALFAAVLAVSAFFAAAVRLAGFFSAVSSAAAAGSAPSALSAAFFLG